MSTEMEGEGDWLHTGRCGCEVRFHKRSNYITYKAIWDETCWLHSSGHNAERDHFIDHARIGLKGALYHEQRAIAELQIHFNEILQRTGFIFTGVKK